jgi:hypothetical protein
VKRRFQLVLIKPSHYHDDGYVIRWWRALIPSNSLASVYGLALDCAKRHVLGEDVEIDIDLIDETNTRVNIPKLIRRFRRHDNFGLLAMVGVQSNQYPRALDLARHFRAAGIPMALGGFHVSGCLSMLDGKAIDLELASDLGISIFAGEAEERLEVVLQDAAQGRMKPLYNFMKDLPSIGGTPTPFLPHQFVKRTAGTNTSFDAGRGCPFQCSFCTIINVQGRKSRFRSPDDIEKVVRENWAQGISRFITDDTARNKIAITTARRLREVDTSARPDDRRHDARRQIPNFIAKAKRAGVTRVFIGLENVNPDNLAAAKKRQNKITEYRKMLLAWKAQSIFVYAGYILGFPGDTPASIRRDISIIKRELPLDMLEFNILTPLPGSEDHKVLWGKGIDMDADLNKYDLEHAVTDHPTMSRDELEAIYQEAWSIYYTPEHIETLLRRAIVTKIPLMSFIKVLVQFTTMMQVEKVHPLQSGLFRLKHIAERRPGLPPESVLAFYPRFLWSLVANNLKLVSTIWWMLKLKRRIERDPDRHRYMDQALTPVRDDDEETLDLLTKTEGGRAAVAHQKKIDELTHAAAG